MSLNTPTDTSTDTSSCKTLDGKILAKQIQTRLKQTIAERSNPLPPKLVVILVGEDSASKIYVNKKRQACEQVGIASEFMHLNDQITTQNLTSELHTLNNRPDVHGILVQLPLPAHVCAETILDAINPTKDVDGFHAYNLGRLAQRAPQLRPCTPKGIMALLDQTQIDYREQHAVVVGASNIVGRPMALELLRAGCTVTVCHRFTKNLAGQVSQGDILIAAAGKPGLIQGEWIKPGCIGIDVGIHRTENGTLVGDIQPVAARQRCAWLTPVPGGVGPMTVASLLENTWQAYQLKTSAQGPSNPDSKRVNERFR